MKVYCPLVDCWHNHEDPNRQHVCAEPWITLKVVPETVAAPEALRCEDYERRGR